MSDTTALNGEPCFNSVRKIIFSAPYFSISSLNTFVRSSIVCSGYKEYAAILSAPQEASVPCSTFLLTVLHEKPVLHEFLNQPLCNSSFLYLSIYSSQASSCLRFRENQRTCYDAQSLSSYATWLMLLSIITSFSRDSDLIYFAIITQYAKCPLQSFRTIIASPSDMHLTVSTISLITTTL